MIVTVLLVLPISPHLSGRIWVAILDCTLALLTRIGYDKIGIDYNVVNLAFHLRPAVSTDDGLSGLGGSLRVRDI